MLNIPVFVSSTFRDFQIERDILNGPVQDRLNETLRPYGAQMQFIDLRWGVDTHEMESEEAERKVLDVCLDEVTRADPLFLGLVGDRYGWISEDKALLEWTAGRAGLEPERARDCSITELEFAKAGLWATGASPTPFILFRDVQGVAPSGWEDADPTRISAFKEQVLARWGETGNVRNYSVEVAPDGRWAEADLLRFEDLAVELLEAPLVEQARNTPHDGLAEEVLFRGTHTHNFGRDWALDSLRWMQVSRLSTVVMGGPGTGKSALLLAFERQLIDSGKTPVTVILGLDDRVWTGDELAFEISQQANKRLGFTLFDVGRGDPDTWRQRWREAMEGVLAGHPQAVFLVDGLDHLIDNTAGFWPLEWLAQRASMSVTTQSEAHSQVLHKLGFQRVGLDTLSSNDVREMVEDWERRVHREIGGAARHIIASKNRTPLWVEMSLELLLDVDSDDFNSIALEADQAGAIVRMLGDRAWLIPDDMPGAVHHFLETSIESTDRAMARAAVGMLGAARIGISQEQVVEALRICGFDGDVEFYVARLFRSLGGQLVPSGPEGRMRFGHRVFGQAAETFGSELTHFALMRTYEPELLAAYQSTPVWAVNESEDYYDIERQWKTLRKLAEAFLYHLFSCPPSKVPGNAMSLPLAFDRLPQTTERDTAVVTGLLHLPYAMDHLKALRFLDTPLEAIRTLLAAAEQTPDPRVQREVAQTCASALENYANRGYSQDLLWVLLQCKTLTMLASFEDDPLEAQAFLHEASRLLTPLFRAAPNNPRVAICFATVQRQMALLFAQEDGLDAAATLLTDCQAILHGEIEAGNPDALEEGARIAMQLAQVHMQQKKDLYSLTSLEQAQEWAWTLGGGGDGPSTAHALMAQALVMRAEVLQRVFPAQAMSLLKSATEEFTYAAQRIPFGERYIAEALGISTTLAEIHKAAGDDDAAYQILMRTTKAMIPLLSEAKEESWFEMSNAIRFIDRLGWETSSENVRWWFPGYIRKNVPRILAQAPTHQPPVGAVAIALIGHDSLQRMLQQATDADMQQRTQKTLTEVIGYLECIHTE